MNLICSDREGNEQHVLMLHVENQPGTGLGPAVWLLCTDEEGNLNLFPKSDLTVDHQAMQRMQAQAQIVNSAMQGKVGLQ